MGWEEEGGQPQQLPSARQEATEQPWCLLSKSKLLSKAREQIPPRWEPGKSVLGGKFLLGDSPGKEEGEYGNQRLRGAVGLHPARGWGRAGPALRQGLPWCVGARWASIGDVLPRT